MTAPDDHRTPASGAAYGRAFRALASTIAFGLLGYGAWFVAFVVPGPIPGAGWTLIAACALMMLGNWYLILCAATTVDGLGVRQSGLIERRVSWDDVWYARVGGFAFSRRLVVRTITGRIRYFFGGTEELHAAFARIAARYPKPRR